MLRRNRDRLMDETSGNYHRKKATITRLRKTAGGIEILDVPASGSDAQPLKRLIVALAGVLIAGSGAEAAHAQDSTVTAFRDLDVGVYVSPPFVEESGAQTYSGMAIDLWELIADRIGLTFQYVRYPTVRDLVQATADGEVDAAVTNLTITRNRARAIAFTQPWYDAGLRVMVPDQGDGGFWGILNGLSDAGHLRAYAWILLVIIAATVAITIFDRTFDPEFPKRWREGVGESFYNVMSIATSGHAPRRTLFGWIGRDRKSVV